ncbi:MAG TPA: hypothetical protein VL832_02265 [Puia sp.]|jgi:hypothetical protein|nr:hypothetical protein [Puia sp.]
MFYPIRLSLIDKSRLVFTHVTPAEFVGMLASYLRDKVPVNNYFYIEGVEDFSFDYYGEENGDEYIANGNNRIPLSKGRSFLGSALQKFSNNPFVEEYHEMKNVFKNAADF